MERGADVNSRGKDHITPLNFASHNRHVELVLLLLDRGANVKAEDSQGWTPLHNVFANPDTSTDVLRVVHLLLERGADVNAPNRHHVISLHLASYHQHLESVQVLLDNGANVNAKDSMGQTPLHRVFSNTSKGYHDFIPQLLLKHGADVNARDSVHETPLHLALRLGFFEGPWVLLKHGADLTMNNKEGMTPFQSVRKIISAQISAAPPGYFSKDTLAVWVILMSLLHEY
ncbi:Ankyrin repeat-containing domain protein [Lactarius tabidus]